MVAEARRRRLLSAEHFTGDGTLLEAWASLKSYRPRDDQDTLSGGGRNLEVDFRGQQRRSDTHASTTDPDARLYRKGPGQKAALSYMGHLLTENRHGLVVDVELTEANGRAEREAAVAMVERSTAGRATLGADRGYDTRDFVAQLRSRGVTPHVAVNDRRWGRGAIDGRTTRHAGYALSQRRRKRVEVLSGPGSPRSSAGSRPWAEAASSATWEPPPTASGWSSPQRPTTWSASPSSRSPQRRRAVRPPTVCNPCRQPEGSSGANDRTAGRQLQRRPTPLAATAAAFFSSLLVGSGAVTTSWTAVVLSGPGSPRAICAPTR